MVLALATALYSKGKTDEAMELTESVLNTDRKYADISYLKKNLWGEKMIEDVQQLLSIYESDRIDKRL